MTFPILTVITFLPALAGFALAPLKEERISFVRAVALGVSGIVLLLAGFAWVRFDGRQPEMQFIEDIAWIPSLGVNYKMGLDGISLVMVVLTAVLIPPALICSRSMPKGLIITLLFLETGMMGAFCALDMFLFYVFWEVMLIPMYLIIGIWGGPRRVTAAMKFIIYTIVGSVLMFAAMIYCYLHAGSFDISTLQEKLPSLALSVQVVLFLAFALSFAIKVPIFPFHTWLPDAHVEAPTAGSVILAGVLLKMGAYGFLRFAIPFFPDAARACSPWIIALAVIGIVYGAAMAMAQSDIKKLVAYSSVSHLGFVMLGIFSGTLWGVQGGVLQMVNHGLSTGSLFLLVGILYERTHRRGVDDFGGMARVMPVYATIFLVVTLSSIGLPGLNGFVGEFMVLFGAFQLHPFAVAIAAIAVVLGAVYMLRLYRDVFFGPVTMPEREKSGDLSRLEFAYLAPLVLLIILLGIAPNAILSKTETAVSAVVRKLEPRLPLSHERDRK